MWRRPAVGGVRVDGGFGGTLLASTSKKRPALPTYATDLPQDCQWLAGSVGCHEQGPGCRSVGGASFFHLHHAFQSTPCASGACVRFEVVFKNSLHVVQNISTTSLANEKRLIIHR